jgi:uncharacterized membrane protein
MTFKKLTDRLFSYFIRGLLLTTPVFVTGYIIYSFFNWLDSKFYFFFPGAGLLTVALVIMGVGAVGSSFLSVPVYNVFDNLLRRIPLVGFLYASVKDLIDAFVGEKQKFNKPVLLTLNNESNIKKLGFMTQSDLIDFDLKDMVAVYCPHSYAFSGETFIVPTANVQPIDLPTAQVMKFIVSGGVSMAEDEDD